MCCMRGCVLLGVIRLMLYAGYQIHIYVPSTMRFTCVSIRREGMRGGVFHAATASSLQSCSVG